MKSPTFLTWFVLVHACTSTSLNVRRSRWMGVIPRWAYVRAACAMGNFDVLWGDGGSLLCPAGIHWLASGVRNVGLQTYEGSRLRCPRPGTQGG